jgi:PAS domain S-box-containing protein
MRSHLDISATEFARTIDVGLYERYREMKTLAEILSSTPHRDDRERQRDILQQYAASGRYAWIGIINPDGTVQVSADHKYEGRDFSGENAFKEGLSGSYVGSVLSAQHLIEIGAASEGQPNPMLDLATPVRDEKLDLVGVLCAYVSWSWLLERYEELNRTLQQVRSVEVLLLDQDGNVLLAPPGSGLEQERFSAGELTDPNRQTHDFLFGAARCTGFRDFPGPGWTILLRQRADVAFASVQRLQANLFLGGLAGAVLAGLAGYWIAGIFTRPIVQLAAAAQKITKGDSISATLPEATEDEIGALTSSLQTLFETRERQAHELRQSFRIFTSTFENAAVGIAQIGTDFHWLRVNHKMAAILGYTADELRTRTFADITYPEDLGADLDHVAELMSGKADTYAMEKRYIRKDGAIIWGRLTASIIRDETGAPDYFIAIVEDITARKRVEDAMRESETRFREMADHAPVLIWTCDDARNCNWVNRPWLEFTGRTLEQELGLGWMEGLHPDDTSGMLAFDEAFKNRAEFRFEHRLRRNDGQYRWMLTQGVPLYRGEAFAGYIGSSSDITENREATENQRRAREAAEAANQAKDEFLAALSHELRTPLNPVLLLASEYENTPGLPLEVRQDFATIHKNVALEARLIDDLLDLTRITRDKIHLRLETTDVHQLLLQALELASSELSAKQLRLDKRLDAQNHCTIGDPVRLQQVFWNVLLNSVKFTPPGGWVRISTANVEPATLRVTVADSGLGIDPAEMPFIFEKFGQGSHSVTPHRFGGLGLGLSIAKLLVERHNGRIWAESAGTGEGSTFHVDLPLLVGESSPPQSGSNGDAQGPVPVQRILLVEDHEPTRTTLSRLLNRRGHSVASAASVAGARELAAKANFDLVISDLGLPDGTGHELMAELKGMYGLSGIALSGYGMEDDIQRSSDAGFCAHLTKPVDVAALESALHALTRGTGVTGTSS